MDKVDKLMEKIKKRNLLPEKQSEVWENYLRTGVKPKDNQSGKDNSFFIAQRKITGWEEVTEDIKRDFPELKIRWKKSQ